jgi:hypothetical protein
MYYFANKSEFKIFDPHFGTGSQLTLPINFTKQLTDYSKYVCSFFSLCFWYYLMDFLLSIGSTEYQKGWEGLGQLRTGPNDARRVIWA